MKGKIMLESKNNVLDRRCEMWESFVIDKLIKDGKITVDPEGKMQLVVYTCCDGFYKLETVYLTSEILDKIEREDRKVM